MAVPGGKLVVPRDGDGSIGEPPRDHRLVAMVERFFNQLKHFRAVATRYEKLDANYLALVKLASVRIWLRANESVT